MVCLGLVPFCLWLKNTSMSEVKVLQPLARWLGRQRWIRFGIRDRFARLVENPDQTRGHAFCQPFFGGTYTGNTGNFIDWSAHYFGAYSREELDLFKDVFGSAPAGGGVIDVGANVGHHSLFYALQGATVFAFEPNPAAMSLLKQKAKANPALSIHPMLKGLSDRADRLPLSVPDHNNLGTASLEKAVGSASVLVEVCSGDHMIEIQRLEHIKWIKIDVEGHELPALLGLRQTIEKHRPAVFFEWNGNGRFLEAKGAFSEGYSFYRFLGDQSLAGVFARPGYRLQLLPADSEPPPSSNVLAIPSARLLKHLSYLAFR